MNIKSLISTLYILLKPEQIRHAFVKSSTINFIARTFGYIKNVAIAVLIGFSFKTDAFFMAISLIGIFLCFTSAFDYIGVPNLVQARQENKEKFMEISGFLMTFTSIISILVLILAFVSWPIISKIPYGFSLNTLYYTHIYFISLMPFLFLQFFFQHFGAILRSQRLFTIYFIGEFIVSFFNFCFVVFGLYIYKNPVIIPVGLSLAQAIGTAYMFFICREHIRFRFFINDTSKAIVKQSLSLIILIIVGAFYVLIDKTFATSLPIKTVSAISYALLIITIPQRIFNFNTILMTSISETKVEIKQFKRYITIIFITGSIIAGFIFIFSGIIIKLLFYYGAFSVSDWSITSTAVKYFALSIPFMLSGSLISGALQVINRLMPMVILSIINTINLIIIDYLTVVIFKMGVIGIAIGMLSVYIISTGLSMFFLFDVLYKKKGLKHMPLQEFNNTIPL